MQNQSREKTRLPSIEGDVLGRQGKVETMVVMRRGFVSWARGREALEMDRWRLDEKVMRL